MCQRASMETGKTPPMLVSPGRCRKRKSVEKKRVGLIFYKFDQGEARFGDRSVSIEMCWRGIFMDGTS